VIGTYILLLRAVNVGGTGSLPMKDLVTLLEKLGLAEIRIYIQSGNAVFRTSRAQAAKLPATIRARLNRKLGFAPEIILLRLEDLESAIASNPYAEAESDAKTLHLTFLASAPKTPDLAALETLRKDNERFTLKGRVFYLHAPDGVGKSRLVARIERALGVAGTARNWGTVCKLRDLADEVAAVRG
jgi:uncharacterized protein (DUF1697 family)